jgi:glycosyltransferase involved in cell wall biosynthesis
MQTTVSVILPVHNAKDFLPETLQSVLTQTHQRFELIAVDDGSTDGSDEILVDFARRDKRIVVLLRRNRGVAAAANECLNTANNELVVRLDADDLMLPNRLERQIWFMLNHPEISVATSYAWLIDRYGNLLAQATPRVDIDRGVRELKPDYFVNLIQPATIMRKTHIEAVGGYSTEYRVGEDRELWGRLVSLGYRLDVQREFLIKQRLHKSSLTANTIRRNILIGEFIDHNIVRALMGQPAFSVDTFLNHRRNAPIIDRLTRSVSQLSQAFYREATRDFAEKDWWPFLKHSSSAVCLNPIWALRMFQKKVRQKKALVESE